MLFASGVFLDLLSIIPRMLEMTFGYLLLLIVLKMTVESVNIFFLIQTPVVLSDSSQCSLSEHAASPCEAIDVS